MNRFRLSLLATMVAAFALSAQGGKDQAYLTVRGTGFAFQYPTAWKLTNTKREQMLTLPTASKHEASVWHFYSVDFRKAIPAWQETQVMVAQEFNRTVERQWQEDILGVPLLLTKTTAVDKKGVPDVVLTGLLYSQSPNKLLFRVTCAAEDFDEADSIWRKAFQTLRTTDGSTPKADDPTKKFTKDDLEAKPSGPLPVTTLGPTVHPKKVVEGPVVVPGKAGGKSSTIRLPKGWKVDAQKDGTWTLTNPELSGEIKMSLASTLDSDPVNVALNKQAGATLDAFTTVADREDVTDRGNQVGGTVNAVWRTGSAASGKLSTFDAVVSEGDQYITLHFKAASAFSPELKHILQALIDGASIDTQP